MRRFVNGIKEHCWDKFLQDWIERRDGKRIIKTAIMDRLLVNINKKLNFTVYAIHVLFI